MMDIFSVLSPTELTGQAKALYHEERVSHKALNSWFLAQEIAADAVEVCGETDPELIAAAKLEAVVEALSLDLRGNSVLAGTKRDAIAASYVLITPAFRVETFRGYCDALEVYDYASPDGAVTAERIAAMRDRASQSPYVRALNQVYSTYSEYTDEVVFFMEQVTGHLIPDFRPALRLGVNGLTAGIDRRLAGEHLSEKHRNNLVAMRCALRCAVRLAERYADLALWAQEGASEPRRTQLVEMERVLRRVPAEPARTPHEALQSYVLLWQVMCLEQAPNPFAFSVENADRIFEPYRASDGLSRQAAAALFKHFLVFFNVGELSWAISQNILLGGRDIAGGDLTNETTYAILDTCYDMILPQPILSVKLHRGTPTELYEALWRFFFTSEVLTPSLFNDDSLFETLAENGLQPEDLPDYAVAGCQEPLIMGKDTGSTTNTWLNLAKIVELTLNGGVSEIAGRAIGPQRETGPLDLSKNNRALFYEALDFFTEEMRKASNGVSHALSLLPVPFLSSFEGGLESAVDLRDCDEQGTKCNGSGCLIHGLSVVSDSFVAIDRLVRVNIEGFDELRAYLKACPKYGNNIPEADNEAAEVARRVSRTVSGLTNHLGNPYRPDWSTPSTHLTYGYWVGATPDGRGSREMMNYGIDHPLFGTAEGGLGFRTLSELKLPDELMRGGCASHFGIDPKYFTAETYEGKGLQFYGRVLRPLFFNPGNRSRAPFYLYINVTTAETLRREPEKRALNSVYIMRIHGTFVNFLDLNPAIQEDIILRLDPASTSC